MSFENVGVGHRGLLWRVVEDFPCYTPKKIVKRVNNFASGRPLSQIPQETKTPIFTETWISDIACSPIYSEATRPCRDFFFVSSGACKRRSSKESRIPDVGHFPRRIES
jgi:hypothetical protein